MHQCTDDGNVFQVKAEVGLENGFSQSVPDPKSETTNLVAVSGPQPDEVIDATLDCILELLVL